MGGTNFTVRSLEGLQKYLKDGGIAFYGHKKPEFLDICYQREAWNRSTNRIDFLMIGTKY